MKKKKSNEDTNMDELIFTQEDWVHIPTSEEIAKRKKRGAKRQRRHQYQKENAERWKAEQERLKREHEEAERLYQKRREEEDWKEETEEEKFWGHCDGRLQSFRKTPWDNH